MSFDSDYQRRLNTFHIPGDAGEWTEGLTAILRRIPDGWGRFIGCSRGWYPIVVRLDQVLAEVDPEYVLLQVKEKFGGLRYYYRQAHPDRRAEMDALVSVAEEEAARTCEDCGAPGVLCEASHWYRTLCPPCAAAADWSYRPVKPSRPA